MKQSKEETLLCAEIGLFIIEFEGVLQYTKDTIENYFKTNLNGDTIPVEILMYDSSSYPVANYYKAVSLYYLDTKHADKNAEDVKKIKAIINKVASQLIKAGEFRNDVVHSTWELSSVYGTNAQLEAGRRKITENGVVMRKLKVKPNIFDNTISMLHELSYYLKAVGDVIVGENLSMSHYQQFDDMSKFNEIDFDKERKNLFSDDPKHYENLRKWREDLDKYF